MEGVRTRSQTRRANAANAVQPERAGQECACDSLPVEVLTDILHRAAKKDFKELFRAQQVCRLWRYASYAVPDIEWCVSSKHAGSALLRFLASRLQLGERPTRINSVDIRFTKAGLVSAPLKPILAALAGFSVQSCKVLGPGPWSVVEGYESCCQEDTRDAAAAVKGTIELFGCISTLSSVEVLQLENFGDTHDPVRIREPLPVPFRFLRVLNLDCCCMKRVVLEQLINSSPNLVEARWYGGHYEEEDETESPSCLHIVSNSLETLFIDQNFAGPPEAHLELDAPDLTSLELDYFADCATLRTPKLVELTMSSVDQINTAPLKDLAELTFQGYCCTFRPQVPNILRCTPHLSKLCIATEYEAYQESELLDLDALLPEFPATLTHLELGWQFLRGLKMRQDSRLVNKSVVKLVISQYYELDGRSELESLKRRLKLLRKAFLGIRKVSIEHLCSNLGSEDVQSILDCFAGVEYVEVGGDGWVTWQEFDDQCRCSCQNCIATVANSERGH